MTAEATAGTGPQYIPAMGSVCPARMWPFKRHRFTLGSRCSCHYCGGRRR